MYYKSEMGLINFIELRESSETLKTTNKDRAVVLLNDQILNISQSSGRKPSKKIKQFEFTLSHLKLTLI